MQVELLISRGNAKRVHKIGDVIDVSDGEGARLIAAGKAKPVRSTEKVETATAKAATEKATK